MSEDVVQQPTQPMPQTSNKTITATFLTTPQALLASAADLSPGLPFKRPPSPTSDEITPRPRHPSSTSSLLNTFPISQSRPESQASFNSAPSPLCTPKIKDFAYPKSHKYHAPSFNNKRYSISSRSSTSSDLDSFFPSRMQTSGMEEQTSWKEEVDGDDEEVVERRAICVFDFEAECEGELTIEIGQVVWVEFRKGASGWLVVRDEITGTLPLPPMQLLVNSPLA